MIKNINQEHKTPSFKNVILNYSHLLNINFESVSLARELIEFSATRYYLDLIDGLINNGKSDSAKCLLKSIIPNDIEAAISSEVTDGIGEDNSVDGNPILSRLFPNRILIAINSRCPQYCRYCFRRRRLGKNSHAITREEIDNAFWSIERDILKSKESGEIQIDEIILSGGEPLIVQFNTLEHIVKLINSIDGIKTCRIDTKLLSVNPEAFTPRLVKLLKSQKNTYIINHFIHPEEVTDTVVRKTKFLLRNEIVVGAHIPILQGINDDFFTIKNLVNKLYSNSIRPYYLIQFIPTKWTEHFRVPLEKSIDIRERLVKECSGFGVPTLIVYLPDGKGKAVINSRRDIKKVEKGYILYNTFNEEVLYEE